VKELKGEPIPSSYPHLDSFGEPFQNTELSTKEDSPNQDPGDEQPINVVKDAKTVPFPSASKDVHVLHEHEEILTLTTSTQAVTTLEKFLKESPPNLPSTFQDPTGYDCPNSPRSLDSRSSFSYIVAQERQLLEDLHEFALIESELLKKLIETPSSNPLKVREFQAYLRRLGERLVKNRELIDSLGKKARLLYDSLPFSPE
jgi:hypothetical protein